MKDSAGNAVASTTKNFEAFHIISDFNNAGAAAGAGLAGNAGILAAGGPDGSDILGLTPNANGQQGSIVFGDVLNGAPVNKFTAQFKLYIGRRRRPSRGRFKLQPQIRHRLRPERPAFLR